MASRAERRQQKTDAILDAAMHIIITDGHGALTIARIAKHLGLAVGALYRYFDGKDAIIAALQQRIVSMLHREMSKLLAQLGQATTPDGAIERLFVATEVYDSFSTRHPAHYLVLGRLLGDPEKILSDDVVADGLVGPFRTLLAQVENAIIDCVRLGAFEEGPAERRTAQLWSTMVGAMVLRKLGRFHPALMDESVSFDSRLALAESWGGDRETCRAALTMAKREVQDALTTENPLSNPT